MHMARFKIKRIPSSLQKVISGYWLSPEEAIVLKSSLELFAWILGGSLHYRGKSAMINPLEDSLQNTTSLLQLLNKMKEPHAKIHLANYKGLLKHTVDILN